MGRQLWERLISERLLRYQLILGPRRVGKTTVMYQTVKHLLAYGIDANRLWWLRLDHPALMRQELGALVDGVCEVSNASEDAPVFLFLDELTYARDWDLWLKTFYDEKRPVRIVGTSSATSVIREQLQESGVGRWEEQYLGPYTLNEYLELEQRGFRPEVKKSLSETLAAAAVSNPVVKGIDVDRRRFLFTGGFPELLLASSKVDDEEETALLESQRTLRTDAIERAIYKDIPQAYGVDRPMLLERMLYVLAEQIGGVLSPTNICSELDEVSAATFEKYLSYLERSFVVFTLQNYSGSERSKQKRGRKLYFTDGAARNAALQRGLAPLSDPGEMGVLNENLAATHLHLAARQSGAQLYHWRHGKHEVDLVFAERDRLVAIEIASSKNHHSKGIRAFQERYGKAIDACYLVAPESTARPANGEMIGRLSLDLLVLTAGAYAEHHLRRRLAS